MLTFSNTKADKWPDNLIEKQQSSPLPEQEHIRGPKTTLCPSLCLVQSKPSSCDREENTKPLPVVQEPPPRPINITKGTRGPSSPSAVSSYKQQEEHSQQKAQESRTQLHKIAHG